MLISGLFSRGVRDDGVCVSTIATGVSGVIKWFTGGKTSEPAAPWDSIRVRLQMQSFGGSAKMRLIG